MPKLNEELSRLLKSVVDHFDKEDVPTRERQIRHWRRLKFYWNNLSQIYWSETAHDYRVYGRDDITSGDQDYYDRPVNVFRAFLETIIAALSISIPGISCVPDDADNPLDLSTAKAGNKLAEQTYKHNNVILLWLHALYVWATEGMVACYIYTKSDKKYGTYDEKQYKAEEQEGYFCPNCQANIPDELLARKQQDKFQPDDVDADLNAIIEEEGPTCPECADLLDENLQKSKLIINRFVGVTKKPKTRVCMEVYGGLYVKVSNYAKKQEDLLYLIHMYETHFANPLEMYPDLRDSMPQGGWSGKGINDPEEQYGRLNTQYTSDYPENTVTIKSTWLRPAAFNVLEKEDCDKLKKKFPNGAKIVLVNDICAEYVNEALDDHWTLTLNPMADFLCHEPAGELLTNIQDIINDLISLVLQTIEHGIAQTWVDPAVVDLEGQSRIEATPGTISPTKPQGSGGEISKAFYSSKTAALAPEIFQMFRIVQELGQFVSGALPSLFGGTMGKGNSQTASEYAMSRSGALQRQQTPWKMMTTWWKEIFGKVIPMRLANIKEDERYVEKDEKNNFINVFIRKAEIEGKIGSVELEASEQLPITEEQQKDIILELMKLTQNEMMQAALFSPENLPFIRKIIRIPQFKLPGEDSRQKQQEEINTLLNSEPIEMPPDETMMMEALAAGLPPPPPERIPSVEVDPIVDDHEVEAATLRSWLISEAGRLAKIENPLGYENNLLHFKMHMDIIQQEQQAQMAAAAMVEQQNQPPGKPAKSPGDKPGNIKGDSDARTPVGQ